MNIGDTISSLRKDKNMTQEELAKKLNVSAKTISSWENNRNLPSIDMIILLSEALDTDINTLLDINKSNVTEKSNAYKKKDFKNQLLKIIFIGLIFIVPMLYFYYVAITSMSVLLINIKSLEEADLILASNEAASIFRIFFLEYFIYLIILLINYLLYKKKYLNPLLMINSIILLLLASIGLDIVIYLLPLFLIIQIILMFKNKKILYYFSLIIDIIAIIIYLITLIINPFDYLDYFIFLIASIISMYWAYKIRD